jgi:hypothetical protein
MFTDVSRHDLRDFFRSRDLLLSPITTDLANPTSARVPKTSSGNQAKVRAVRPRSENRGSFANIVGRTQYITLNTTAPVQALVNQESVTKPPTNISFFLRCPM